MSMQGACLCSCCGIPVKDPTGTTERVLADQALSDGANTSRKDRRTNTVVGAPAGGSTGGDPTLRDDDASDTGGRVGAVTPHLRRDWPAAPRAERPTF